MEKVSSEDESSLLRKLQALRQSVPSASLPPPVVDKVMVRHLVTDYLNRSRITPSAAQIDALIDDIEHYIKKTFIEFVTFLRHGEEGSEV